MVTVIKPIFLVVIAGGFYVNAFSLRSLSKRQLVEENNAEQGDTIEIVPVENETNEFTEEDQHNLVEFLENSLQIDDAEPIDVTSNELKSLELADQEVILDQVDQDPVLDETELVAENLNTSELFDENIYLEEEEQQNIDNFLENSFQTINEEPIEITDELETLELSDQEVVLDESDQEELSENTDLVLEISDTSDVSDDIAEFADEDSELEPSNEEITFEEQVNENDTPYEMEAPAEVTSDVNESIDVVEFEPIEGVFENEEALAAEEADTPEAVSDAEQTQSSSEEVVDSVEPESELETSLEELVVDEISEEPITVDDVLVEPVVTDNQEEILSNELELEKAQPEEEISPLDEETTFESINNEVIAPIGGEDNSMSNKIIVSEEAYIDSEANNEIVESDYEVVEGILPPLSSEISEILESDIDSVDNPSSDDIKTDEDPVSDDISSLTEFEKLAAQAVIEDVFTAEAEALIEQGEPEDYEVIDDETLEALDQLESAQETVVPAPESLDTSSSNTTPETSDSSNSLKQDITENTIPLPDLPIQNIHHHTPAQMTFDFLANAHHFDFQTVSNHLIRSFTLTIPNYNCLESGLPNLQLIEDRLTNKFIELGLLSATQDIFTVSDAQCGSLIVTFEVIEPQEVDAKMLIENHLTEAVRAIVDDEEYEHEAFLSEYQPSKANKLAFGLESKKKLVNLLLLEAMSNSQVGDALTLMYLQGRFEQGYDGQKEEMLLTMFLLNKKY